MSTLSTENRVVLMALYCLVLIFGIAGNLCLLCTLIFSKTNRKRIQNLYLLALSIADTLFCSIFSPYMLTSYVDPKITVQYEISCKIMTFLNYTLAAIGLVAITALSLDRYFAIRFPFLYQRYINVRLISCINLGVYIYPIACSCPLLSAKEYTECDGELGNPTGINWRKLPIAYFFLMTVLLFIVPGVILIFTNIYVFVIARKQYLKCGKNQSVKMDQVSSGTSIDISDDRDQALNVSHKNSLQVNDIQEKISFENEGFRQDICPYDNYSIDTAQHPKCGSEMKSSNKSRTNVVKNTETCKIASNNNIPVEETRHQYESTEFAEFEFKLAEDKDMVLTENTGLNQTRETGVKHHSNVADIDKHCSRDFMIHNEMKSKRSKKQRRQQKLSQDWKIAIMTVALVIGFFVTWLPFAASRTAALINRRDATSSIDYYAAAFTTLNSVINPYLIFATRKDLRRFIYFSRQR